MIGSIIKEERRKKGLTQQELADSLGVARSLVARYESDSVTPPLSKIKKLSEILGPRILACFQSDKAQSDFESLCLFLNRHGYRIEPTGFGIGPDWRGDQYDIISEEMGAGIPVDTLCLGDLFDLVAHVEWEAERMKNSIISAKLRDAFTNSGGFFRALVEHEKY
jgi:transcriptional regulator with XRE-family HTH domain